MKAGLAAFAATDGAVNHSIGRDAHLRLKGLRRWRAVLLLAVLAQDAHQPLRQNRLEPWKHFWTAVPVAGLIEIDDTGVVPGQSYRYRIRVLGSPRDQYLNEVEVEVPR